MLRNILFFCSFIEQSDKTHENFILLVGCKFLDWNSIFQVKAKRWNSIVDNHNIFDIDVFQYSQVLNVAAIFGLDAMIAVKDSFDWFWPLVQILDDELGIAQGWWCEYKNIIVDSCSF